MNIRKFISLAVCLALSFCSIGGCNSASQNQDTAKTEEASAVTSI